MNGPVPTPQVLSTPPPFYKNRLFLAFIILALVLLAVLVAVKYLPILSQKAPPQISQTQIPQEKVIKEQELPIGVDILKNPVVYQWSGSVGGILVAKDQTSITISKDGSNLTIPLDPVNKDVIFFNKKGAGQRPPKFMTLDEVPIGSRLLGNFFVRTDDKNKIIGSSFMVVGE